MEHATPVWAPSSGLTYKNKFCALCHLEEDFAPWRIEASCSSSEVFYGVKSQTDVWKVILDWDNCTITSEAPEKSDQRKCRLNVIGTYPSSFTIKKLGNCSSLLCPQRYVSVAKTCKPIFQSAFGLGYKISISHLPTKPVRVSKTHYIRSKYESSLRERLQSYSPYVLSPLDVTVVGEKVLKPERHVIVTGLQVSFQIVSSKNVTMDTIESDFKKLKKESWVFSSRDNVTETEFVSTFQRPYTTGVILNSSITYGSSSVFGRRCEREDCLRHVEFLDISDTLQCVYVDVKMKVLGSYNISLHGSSLTRQNKMVQLETGTFKTFGDKIHICTSQLELIGDLLKETHVDVQEHPYWQSVLSTICLAVSCVFLFLTFVVHLLVPKLQTLPGKNTMALVFFLFLAQMLYLTGIQATEHENVCRAIGIVLHYLWLVTFFWMFICAFQMHSMFTNICNNTPSPWKIRKDRKTFVQYILIACLAPVVFVGGCIGYSEAQTDGINIGYGGKLCFINLIEAKGIFFAGPVVLMLILNAFYYIRTVLAIKRLRTDIKVHNKSNRNYVGIYFRLSILLGLGWVFVFLPYDFSIPIFLILSGGQGFFIFVSVCANRSVETGLSKKICCCRHFLSDTSVTESSEMSSKVNISTDVNLIS